MHKNDIIGSSLLMALFIAAYVASLNFPEQVGIYPQLICVFGIILSFFVLVKALFLKKKNVVEVIKPKNTQACVAVTTTLIATLCYIMLISVIGYAVTTVAFIAFFSYVFDNSSKIYMYPLVAIFITLIIYVLFVLLLYVPLPQGLWM